MWIKDHFFVRLSFVPALVAMKKNQCRAKRLFRSNCQASRTKRNYNPRLSARRTRKPNWPPGVITGEEDISGEGRASLLSVVDLDSGKRVIGWEPGLT